MLPFANEKDFSGATFTSEVFLNKIKNILNIYTTKTVFGLEDLSDEDLY
jgi:hypothetical protein